MVANIIAVSSLNVAARCKSKNLHRNHPRLTPRRFRHDAHASFLLLIRHRTAFMDLKQSLTACSQTSRLDCFDQLHLQHAQ